MQQWLLNLNDFDMPISIFVQYSELAKDIEGLMRETHHHIKIFNKFQNLLKIVNVSRETNILGYI